MAAVTWAVTVGQVYRNPDAYEGNSGWIFLGVLVGLVLVGAVVGLIRSSLAERRFERRQRRQKVDGFGVEIDSAWAGATGVMIAAVLSGSPADDAGLQAGDLVTAVDGTALSGVDDLRGRIRRHGPGEPAQVTVVRAGREWARIVEVSSDWRAGGSTPAR